MVRVVIADDEAMIRAGVRSILTADPRVEVVAEAADGHEAVEACRRHRPDIVLMDIRMPKLDGLAAAAELRAAKVETAVVVLTTFGEDAYISRALDQGAAGFLLKASDPRDLISGVHAVAAGGACLSPLVARRLITEMRRTSPPRAQDSAARTAALTAREQEVLGLLGAGLSNAEIARRLHLVEGTVKGYVSTILARLGVRNRVQAAIVAHEASLVDPAEPA
ncbi:response regulator transcription factor [Streptomyces sp. DSM 42041]|uniref:Response regulator transcription factor n=1 Tax=Streptomyces hazeniae TaxID=3075538 RepID=A0ABU2NQ51_9ACTN|nr:response regulator transcription factor [Streptomyces sp. DSM 42041]MDT0377733.1 response regulator transcription factor [Streptomyces sp. DSM 42041]